jgi:hypothetical protein
MAKSKLTEEFRKMTREWSSEIVRRANESDKPSHITVRSRTNVNDGKVDINISASSPKGDARAYEYGSGIHSRLPNISPWQEGSRGFIVITPKKKKLLAFHWDTMNNIMEQYGEEAVREALRYSHKFVGFAEDGRYLFKFVEHPGVEAANGGKGYIGPAVTEVRKKIRKQIPTKVREQILGDINKTFKKSKGS